MRATLVRFAMGVGVLVSAACAPTVSTSTGPPEASPTMLPQSDLGPRHHGWLNNGFHLGSLIYLAAGSQVRVYPESGVNQRQIASITDGVSGAYGLFVDGDRDLYVANSTTITAYHPGTLSPYIVYSDPGRPLYVVKTHAGWLYAANQDGTVSEYPPGRTRPDRTLQTPGSEADGINVDDESNLYVAYRDASGMGSIKKFGRNLNGGRILGMQLTQPQGLQLDHAGNILVVETGDKQVVDIFPPGSTSPSKVVQATEGVTQVVLREANETMYVSNRRNGNVYISQYPPGEFQPKIKTNSAAGGMALSNEER
jgi:hypothetical protein